VTDPARKTVLCCIGTRPEVIKMAPVVHALQACHWARCRVVATGQHRQLQDQMLDFFDISPHLDLQVMTEAQSLTKLTAKLLVAVGEALQREKPDFVLAQGDTMTVLATAMASFHHRLPFGHVEAGLRTHTLQQPFPEESNRVLVGRLATLHFAPTETARGNLLGEGVSPARIHLTGNTVIDALLMTARKGVPLGVDLDADKRLILITAHRRDSFGEPIREVCRAVATLAARHDDVEFLWPLHPNPAVRPMVEELLGRVPRVRLCEPLGYGRFVTAMKRAVLILTDSGGIQEEAPSLGKPVLVMRESSERPEAIEANVARLVGTDASRIVQECGRLLDDPEAYANMSESISPYGDGQAAPRIVDAVGDFLGVGRKPAPDGP